MRDVCNMVKSPKVWAAPPPIAPLRRCSLATILWFWWHLMVEALWTTQASSIMNHESWIINVTAVVVAAAVAVAVADQHQHQHQHHHHHHHHHQQQQQQHHHHHHHHHHDHADGHISPGFFSLGQVQAPQLPLLQEQIREERLFLQVLQWEQATCHMWFWTMKPCEHIWHTVFFAGKFGFSNAVQLFDLVDGQMGCSADGCQDGVAYSTSAPLGYPQLPKPHGQHSGFGGNCGRGRRRLCALRGNRSWRCGLQWRFVKLKTCG